MATYGGEFLFGQQRRYLDIIYDDTLTLALGLQVRESEQGGAIARSYAQWFFRDTKLGMRVSHVVKRKQLEFYTATLLAHSGTSLSRDVAREAWRGAWARLISGGVLPSKATAATWHTLTLSEEVLKNLVKSDNLRHLAVREPWSNPNYHTLMQAALVVLDLEEKASKWDDKYGPPSLYQSLEGSRRSWLCFHMLQANPLLMVKSIEPGELQCVACGETGTDENWVKKHTLWLCGDGQHTTEARALAADAGRRMVAGWDSMEESRKAELLLGEAAPDSSGNSQRLNPSFALAILQHWDQE